MSLIDKINKHPAITAGVMMVPLALGAVLIYISLYGGGPSSKVSAWYYDTETGQTFAARIDKGPVKTPSGKDALKAAVFACGKCEDAAARTTAYVQTNITELQAAGVAAAPDGAGGKGERAGSAAGRDGPRPNKPKDQMVAKPAKEPEWLHLNSPEGKAIVDAAQKCADGTKAIACPEP